MVYRNTDVALPRISGAGVPVALPHHDPLDRQRPLHAAAPERRQLRGRGDQHAGQHVARSATIPRRSTPRGTIPTAACRTSSATACGCGASTTWTWAARGDAVGLGPVAGRLGAGLQPRGEERQPLTGDADRHPRGGGLSRRPGRGNACSSAIAGRQNVRRLRRASTCRSTTTSRSSARCGRG